MQYLIADASISGVSATPGTLSNVKITPESYITGDIVAYTFTFNFASRIIAGSEIVITAPS